MNRLHLLDGMRGYFLVFMLLNHLWFDGGNPIALINHNQLSFVEDAQGFILISGLIVGLYYGRLHATGRAAEANLRIRSRIWELYLYSLAVLGLVVALALLLPAGRSAWSGLLGDLDGADLPAAMLLLYQPTFMDILPQYMLYLAVSPLLIRLTLSGRGGEVVAASFALWASVQFGLHLPLIAAFESAVGSVHPAFALRGHFNPLAWQIVFVTGLVAGTLMAANRLRPEVWFSPERSDLARVAVAAVLFFMVWRVGFEHGFIPDALAERFWRLQDRAEFSLVYLLNFAALGYLVTWLLVAGPCSRSVAAQWIGWGLHRLFSLSALRFLGGHSLQVYAYHVVLAYLVIYLDQTAGSLNHGETTAITLLAVSSLALPAWLHRRFGRRAVPPPAPVVTRAGS